MWRRRLPSATPRSRLCRCRHLARLEDREPLLDHFEYMMLKGVLQAGVRSEVLIYLQDLPLQKRQAQPATAGRLTSGSSLSPVIVSRVM